MLLHPQRERHQEISAVLGYTCTLSHGQILLVHALYFYLTFSDASNSSLGMIKKAPSLPSLHVPKHLFRHRGCPLQPAVEEFSVCSAPRPLCCPTHHIAHLLAKPGGCSRGRHPASLMAAQEGFTLGLALTPPLSAMLRAVGALHAWSVLRGGNQAREGVWLCSAPCQDW